MVYDQLWRTIHISDANSAGYCIDKYAATPYLCFISLLQTFYNAAIQIRCDLRLFWSILQLKMLNRIATVKDDGTVEVQVPSNIEPLALDVGPEDTYAEAVDEEPLESTDLQYIPPLQIVILIVGTRGDVQPFVAIGKRLQVSIFFRL